MTDEVERACETCQWWIRQAVEDRGRTVPSTHGWCMHSPPTAMGEGGMGKWPLVLGKGWCGQWMPKSE